MQAKSPTELAVASQVVVFELEVGARQTGRSYEFHTIFPWIKTYPITESILIESAALDVHLVKQNLTIGIMDVFIATTAIHHNLPLLTAKC